MSVFSSCCGLWGFCSSTLTTHTFGFSSQSSGSPNSERYPRSSPSSAGNLLLLAECSFQVGRNRSCEHNPTRDRSRSPAIRHASVTVLGHSLEELGYIRLIPRTNEGLQFEFRRYCFPVGKPIRLRAPYSRWVPVPTQEHIVLSLSNGDVFAILDFSGFLSAIYRADGQHRKVKINMISGEVNDLTPDEIRDCPVGKNQPIFPRNFIKAFASGDTLQSVWNPHSEPQESPLRSRIRYFPGRPPTGQVVGCAIEELGYIRLISGTNPNRVFEFRRYVFPSNKKIRIRIEHLTYSYVPNREYMVLSTSDDDAFAIMDDSDTLRGMYKIDQNHSRIKINMISGEVINLNPDEMRDCPVGKNHPILPNSFTKAFANHDSLQFTWKSHGEGNPSSSSSAARPRSPPGRPPSHEVLGYSLAKLGYIRLIPQANQNQRFEFRRYVISANKPIRLLIGNGLYDPVPTREYIVLSTSNGDVFAILEHTGILRGIYGTNKSRSRIKINMISGKVEYMTATELKECHVGLKYPIFPRYFHEEVSNEDSLQHVYH